MLRGKIHIALLVLSSLILVACSTHNSQMQATRSAWESGNLPVAQNAIVSASKDNLDGDDQLIWLLEKGTVERANNNIAKSSQTFEQAISLFDKYESEPDIKISEEATAFVANQSYTTYKGYFYDKIMATIYQSLNYIELNDYDNARAKIIKLGNYQKESVSANIEKIEKEEKAIRDASQKQISNNTKNTAKTKIELEQNTKSILSNSEWEKYYPDYKTPDPSQIAKRNYATAYGYFISGIFFLHLGEDIADIQNAQDMFRLATSMIGGNSKSFDYCYNNAESASNGKAITNTTYIIYETGSAPLRQQFKINIPLFIADSKLPHVSLNFPYLQYRNSYTQDLKVSANNTNYSLETISNFDDIIKTEFYDTLPSTITKTLLSATAKATTQYFLAQASGDFDILVNIAGGIYQSYMNNADLRTWTTLPKLVRIVAFPTPADEKVTIESKIIRVNKNSSNIIFAKRMSANGNLILRCFALPKKINQNSK